MQCIGAVFRIAEDVHSFDAINEVQQIEKR